MKGNSKQPSGRIVLAIETRLLREMLKRAIVKSPYLRVVGEIDEGTDLLSLVKQKHAEWVIVSLLPDGKLPEAAKRLLANRPSVSILAFAPDGSQVKMGWTDSCKEVIAEAPNGSPVELRWTEPHEEFLGDLSLDELISVLCKGSLWELTVQNRLADSSQR